jgi:hypothetical protein
VSKDSDQTETAPRKFKLGPLGSLNQVTKGLAKTIRAMADGSLDSQVGARICNGLGIMRACLGRARVQRTSVDEVAEAEAQGLPYVLAPRVLSREEWEKKYCKLECPSADQQD